MSWTAARARLLIKHVPPRALSRGVIGTFTATLPLVPRLRSGTSSSGITPSGTVTGTFSRIKNVRRILPSTNRSVGLSILVHAQQHLRAFTLALVKVVAFRKTRGSSARTRAQSGTGRVEIVGAVHVAANAQESNGEVLVDKGTVSRGHSGKRQLANTIPAIHVSSRPFARVLAATGSLDVTSQFGTNQGVTTCAFGIAVHPKVVAIWTRNLCLIARVLTALKSEDIQRGSKCVNVCCW